MNKRIFINSTAILLGAFLLISCSSTKLRKEARTVPIVASNPILPTTPITSPANLDIMAPSPPVQIVHEEVAEDPVALRTTIEKDERSVFFEYNKSDIHGDYNNFFANVSNEILTNRIGEIRVEGNTDIRGSRAYNMALGQQRAEAVRSKISSMGIPSSKIRTISYGKERPLATGVDEESHAINRRADILYQGEY